MKYIRDTYNVPAKRGGLIRFKDSNGNVWEGKITSAFYGRLRVKLNGLKYRSVLHPTWNIEYLK